MSGETTPAKDFPVVLQEATSKKGNKYQASVVASKSGFAVDVNWPPTRDWVYLSEDLARKIHITRGGVYFEWSIWFTNTDNYDFFFEDKTHDEYENNTWFNRDHETSYNSDDPTIIRVRGV
ncbi:hypothetical protein EKO27_g9798 [Xylaria grammica]|uniref:Uncharacterized protein n=1 Tax=Xylaria grammica TaxID=363999 RepID=A0A439CT08_9PEZI|nr:hypothetical protein EKO27_g9798 [Xylaria grammica]